MTWEEISMELFEKRTAKRFKVTDNTNNPFLCDWNVTDYADGGIVHHPMTSENMANVMCDLLNELHEENQALKQSQASTLREFEKGTKKIQQLAKENKELKELIKKTLETTPIEHNLAIELKNSVREFYD